MHIDGFNITSSQVWFQTQFVASLRHTSIWPGTIFLAHTRSVVAAFFLPAPRNKRIKNPKYMSFSTVVASHHQALADEPPNPCSVDHGPPASHQNGNMLRLVGNQGLRPSAILLPRRLMWHSLGNPHQVKLWSCRNATNSTAWNANLLNNATEPLGSSEWPD